MTYYRPYLTKIFVQPTKGHVVALDGACLVRVEAPPGEGEEFVLDLPQATGVFRLMTAADQAVITALGEKVLVKITKTAEEVSALPPSAIDLTLPRWPTPPHPEFGLAVPRLDPDFTGLPPSFVLNPAYLGYLSG